MDYFFQIRRRKTAGKNRKAVSAVSWSEITRSACSRRDAQQLLPRGVCMGASLQAAGADSAAAGGATTAAVRSQRPPCWQLDGPGPAERGALLPAVVGTLAISNRLRTWSTTATRLPEVITLLLLRFGLAYGKLSCLQCLAEFLIY